MKKLAFYIFILIKCFNSSAQGLIFPKDIKDNGIRAIIEIREVFPGPNFPHKNKIKSTAEQFYNSQGELYKGNYERYEADRKIDKTITHYDPSTGFALRSYRYVNDSLKDSTIYFKELQKPKGKMSQVKYDPLAGKTVEYTKQWDSSEYYEDIALKAGQLSTKKYSLKLAGDTSEITVEKQKFQTQGKIFYYTDSTKQKWTGNFHTLEKWTNNTAYQKTIIYKDESRHYSFEKDYDIKGTLISGHESWLDSLGRLIRSKYYNRRYKKDCIESRYEYKQYIKNGNIINEELLYKGKSGLVYKTIKIKNPANLPVEKAIYGKKSKLEEKISWKYDFY